MKSNETIPITSGLDHDNNSNNHYDYGTIHRRPQSQLPPQHPPTLRPKINLRFMVMIYTGITFFICILFIFVQSALSILHDRHNSHHNSNSYINVMKSKNPIIPEEEIIPDQNGRNNHPSSVSSTFDDNDNYNNCHESSYHNNHSCLHCTFRQLGQMMVPSAYENMMETIQQHLFVTTTTTTSQQQQQLLLPCSGNCSNNEHTITTTTTTCSTTATKTTTTTTCLQPPSNVNNIRKQILFVRDLLDIFSPIYRNTTTSSTSSTSSTTITSKQNNNTHPNDSNNNDPWTVIRRELDIGYTLIGQYQDLDHSHVQYTIQDISIIQWKILQWYHQFWTSSITTTNKEDGDTTSTVRGTSIQQYLSLTTNETIHTTNTIIPTTTTTTWYTHTAESRLFWKGIPKDPCTRIKDHPDQHHHHKSHLPQLPQSSSLTMMNHTASAMTIIQLLFVKQLRLAQKYYIRAYPHISVLENDFEQMDYHNLRKILRCIVDEYNMFFTVISSSSSKCKGPILFLDTSIITITMDDIRTFDIARQMLGDLNDDWNAYKFDISHHPYHKQENEGDIHPLMQSIDTKWEAFKSWSTDTVDLNGVFTRLLECS